MTLRANLKYLNPMRAKNVYEDANFIYKTHVKYISQKISPKCGTQFCGSVINLYMEYVIDAIVHGYKINVPNSVSFSISRIPVKDIYKYRGFKFKSKFTSDWLFYIDIESNTLQKNDIKYVPTNKIVHTVKPVLNSEKIYELIR